MFSLFSGGLGWLVFVCSETGPHVAKDGLKLPTRPRMTGTSASTSQMLGGATGVPQCLGYVAQGIKPALQACKVRVYQLSHIPSPSMYFNSNIAVSLRVECGCCHLSQ